MYPHSVSSIRTERECNAAHRVPDGVPSRLHDRALDIAILAGVRFSTKEPHAGGLERHTDTLARELVRAGHVVTVFAGSREEISRQDVPYRIEPLVERRYVVSGTARADVSMPADRFMIEHDAYLDVLDRLDRFDVVHNNSLHYLPVVTPTGPPIVHTLHTPPTPWLESAYRIRGERIRRRRHGRSRVVSVSHSNASQWTHDVDSVVHNGVQVERWRSGPGGSAAVWSGRLVPEKGVHLALDAARIAGIDLFIAGPQHDVEYFEAEVRPRLKSGPGEYLGHLGLDELATLTAHAAVAVVTPCWSEPFGLVAAEALSSATPVAAFDCGALREVVTPDVGALAPGGDVDALAAAIGSALDVERRACRRRAVDHFSAATMTKHYVTEYTAARGEALKSA